MSDFVGKAPDRAAGTIMVGDGRYVDPMRLGPNDFRGRYLLGLANVCRFSGQIKGATWGRLPRRALRWLRNPTSFYSVAQHQVLGARYLLSQGLYPLARWFGLHDATEYAMGDIARPVKHRPEMGFYRDAEAKNLLMLAWRFGLQWPIPPEVKEVDNRMLATEVRDMMGDPPWEGLPEPYDFRIEPWPPGKSAREYAKILRELGLWTE